MQALVELETLPLDFRDTAFWFDPNESVVAAALRIFSHRPRANSITSN